MKLAYLLNSYPMTSTTFIRREIHAIEAAGQPVTRFSVRHWDGPLVEAADIEEQRRTEYLLTGNLLNLLVAAMLEVLTNPIGLWRTLPLTGRVWRARGADFLKHMNYLLQAIFLRRRARALGIDHIHAHFSTNATTVAMLSHALGGPSYSFTVHGPDELVEPRRNALALKVERSRFVAAITAYCAGRVEAEAPGFVDKIRIVPCGIDLADFASNPAVQAEPRHLVCVGRLCANKAQILIPQAIAQVVGDFPDMVVSLIGDGEDRAAIEAEIRRLGVERNMRLLGWAGTADVKDQIERSIALLLPSFAEGLPIVLMEALAVEKPVLTTIIAGIPELVDDGCGWIFPAGSIDQLAQALREVLRASPKELAALGREGRRRVEQTHDVRRCAATLLGHIRGDAVRTAAVA